MRPFLALCLTTALLQAGAPLAVVRAVREGEPPYEDDQRLYRLEGDGVELLEPGTRVLLFRPREKGPMARLEVVRRQPGFALARIERPGASFPLRGDLAIPREPLRTPPPFPDLGPTPVPGPGPLAWIPASPGLAVPGAAHREPIFFLQDDAGLTPGAKAKLKAWVAAWGRTGRWVLALPPGAGPLAEARIDALREELGRLGVPRIELGSVPQAPPGKYPAVMVLQDPG